MEWQKAGSAWGSRAVDWAYLMEPYARPANDKLFDELGVGPGVRLLDVACGSGGIQTFDEKLRKALAPFEVDGIGIRLPNEFGFITGTAFDLGQPSSPTPAVMVVIQVDRPAGTLSGSSGPGMGSTGGGGRVSGVSDESSPGSSGTGSVGSIGG